MPTCFRTVNSGSSMPFIRVDTPVAANGVPDYTQCEFVVLSGSDYHLLGGGSAWRELGNLTIDNAHLIGLAVGAVWAIAFTFRLLAKAVIDPPQNGTPES